MDEIADMPFYKLIILLVLGAIIGGLYYIYDVIIDGLCIGKTK